MAGEGATVQGVDFAASMVAKARQNYPHVEFCQGDAEALAAANRAFDHVVCAFGVMHISRPEKAIAEASRVLQPQGHYVLTQWALDDELLKIATSAIADHGAPVDNLPDAPAPLRFSDPAECLRVLQIAGFGDVRAERIETAWTAERPEALLELIYGELYALRWCSRHKSRYAAPEFTLRSSVPQSRALATALLLSKGRS